MNCERFIVTLNVIMIMMRVFCTVMTFCLSRLKLRPGLLSPFAHALTQTVCKMYHAYYVLLISCIHKPFYFQLCLHGALTGYLCWPSTPHLLYEAAVVKFYCTAACAASALTETISMQRRAHSLHRIVHFTQAVAICKSPRDRLGMSRAFVRVKRSQRLVRHLFRSTDASSKI